MRRGGGLRRTGDSSWSQPPRLPKYLCGQRQLYLSEVDSTGLRNRQTVGDESVDVERDGFAEELLSLFMSCAGDAHAG